MFNVHWSGMRSLSLKVHSDSSGQYRKKSFGIAMIFKLCHHILYVLKRFSVWKSIPGFELVISSVYSKGAFEFSVASTILGWGLKAIVVS